ncbi:MAG: hypothetical protein MUP82_00770 [Candidatus Marinimicrobia bacterium]|nr:hypothetical protein [Candidatus Neomarinimicrobiota bacterium]
MTTLDNENVGESSTVYCCEKCYYTTDKKYNLEKHFLTLRHLKTTNNNDFVGKSSKKVYICEKCEKVYNDRAGLWRHHKKCDIVHFENNSDDNLFNKNVDDSDVKLLTNMVLEVVKQNKELACQNQELQKHMIELCKNGTHNTITHTNSHNKAFNLNFFLNETCKNAMNITEFVESIKLQLSDLEKVGELGYVEGISNIIVKNLKDLDITQRPVHCTDKKRETMYIKDEDRWEKDDEQKKMHKMVRKVADKNARMLPKFKEAHPDCNKSTSLYSDQYNKIIIEAMGGRGDNDFEKEEKIIKRVSKEVIVDKE